MIFKYIEIFQPLKTEFMKTNAILKQPAFFRKLMLAIFSVMLTMLTFAQDGDKKVDININTNKDNFWTSPWVWIIGGAVFILLLVALLRGGGSRRDA